jgi:hypothetical protein
MNEPLESILHRYLDGELSLPIAAHEILGRQAEPGSPILASFQQDPEVDRERMDALMGYILWLSVRSVSPENAPAVPFGAEEARLFIRRGRSAIEEHLGKRSEEEG